MMSGRQSKTYSNETKDEVNNNEYIEDDIEIIVDEKYKTFGQDCKGKIVSSNNQTDDVQILSSKTSKKRIVPGPIRVVYPEAEVEGLRINHNELAKMEMLGLPTRFVPLHMNMDVHSLELPKREYYCEVCKMFLYEEALPSHAVTLRHIKNLKDENEKKHAMRKRKRTSNVKPNESKRLKDDADCLVEREIVTLF